jgi:hypothetical protein
MTAGIREHPAPPQSLECMADIGEKAVEWAWRP